MLAAATRALESLGAEVRLLADAENCVRRREGGEPCAAGGDAARLPFVIEVQGLPNLLHELAHVVLLGRVEKDHATPYAKIPFDLTTAEGRRLLFEELACCVASASFHQGDDAAAQAWFAEQVGIQGCFFGFENDLPQMVAAIAREVAAHRDELDTTIERAHVRLAIVLGAAGAPPEVALPRRRFDFDRGWSALVGSSGESGAAAHGLGAPK
jgi:hypothetical protein